jgi:hypothetical protein
LEVTLALLLPALYSPYSPLSDWFVRSARQAEAKLEKVVADSKAMEARYQARTAALEAESLANKKAASAAHVLDDEVAMLKVGVCFGFCADQPWCSTVSMPRCVQTNKQTDKHCVPTGNQTMRANKQADDVCKQKHDACKQASKDA